MLITFGAPHLSASSLRGFDAQSYEDATPSLAIGRSGICRGGATCPYAAVSERRIGGAGLDATAVEPPPADNRAAQCHHLAAHGIWPRSARRAHRRLLVRQHPPLRRRAAAARRRRTLRGLLKRTSRADFQPTTDNRPSSPMAAVTRPSVPGRLVVSVRMMKL